MQTLASPMSHLNRAFDGFNNSVKFDFWHLLELPLLLSSH